MNAERADSATLGGGVGIYLRALGQCFGLDQSLIERELPKEEQQAFGAIAPPSKPISSAALLSDVQHHLALWHPQQIKARLTSFSDPERRRCWSFLAEDLAKLLSDDPHFTPLPPWPSEMSRTFFRRRFIDHLGIQKLRPTALLTPTPFDYLLEFTARDFSLLTDLMALHTLFTPLKHMIEREKRESLKEAVKAASNGATLLAYMRYLQSDINEQTASITAIQFPLYQWDWKLASFEPLLHHFGLYCLAQMLKDAEEEFLDHICLKLDLATSTQFRFSLKQVGKKRFNQDQITQTLRRLAAKASDFISSQYSPQRVQ